MSKERKIAIVYDWFDKWGGVERVLLTFHKLFPQAVFYTSYIDLKKAPWAENFEIKTSFIQSLPGFIKSNRILSLSLYPYAFESFDFSAYDLVLSITSSFAKGVITKPSTRHICYLLTPPRFLWSHTELYPNNSFVAKKVKEYFRRWDFTAAQRPDEYYAISQTVADRCGKYYRRNAQVIYPPFDIDYWRNIRSRISDKNKIVNKSYYLLVGRMENYKRIDVAIKAFNRRQDWKLVIIGQGSKLSSLRHMAKKNVLFYQNVKDEDLALFYSGAEALIMTQEEDFGYVALEAQFFGCPIIAYKKGGSMETVINGKTGIFFDNQTENSLIEAIERFSQISYNMKQLTKNTVLRHIARFSEKRFNEEMLRIITS